MGIYGDLDLTWKTDPVNNRRRKLYRIMTKEMKSKIAIRENWSRQRQEKPPKLTNKAYLDHLVAESLTDEQIEHYEEIENEYQGDE